MCLSKVYLREGGKDKIVVEEASGVIDNHGIVKDLDSKSDANYGWVADINDYEHLLLHIKGIPHSY